jgi:hypothetical protein
MCGFEGLSFSGNEPLESGTPPFIFSPVAMRAPAERPAAPDLWRGKGPRVDRARARRAHGNRMRPGDPLVPDCVWQPLQSPELCGVPIMRSRPM